MRLSLYTYNGTQINDVTNFYAMFAQENYAQGGTDVVFIKRPYVRPVYAGKVLSYYQLILKITMMGNQYTQIDTLKALFNVEDQTAHKLICKDTGNDSESSKQWYIYATTASFKYESNKTVVVTLAVADPVWTSVTEYSASKNVTASGQTLTVTTGGNVNAHPRIEIIPTGVRGAGFAYKRNVNILNPNSVALPNYAIEITGGGWNTSALLSYTTNKVLINKTGGITAADTTIPYDTETGTFPLSGLAMIENEQIRYTGKSGGNITGVTRGVNGTTAATHADNTIIYQSLIQADGNDIRVKVGGKWVSKWIYGINTSTTKIWIAQDLDAKITATLGTAIASSGAITEIYLQKTPANAIAFNALANSGELMIGTELFRYTGRNGTPPYWKLTGVTRGLNGTSMAAHAVGDTITATNHPPIWVYYGNLTISDPSSDYSNYDDNKPMFNLSSSNGSWDWDYFKEYGKLRSGAWSAALKQSANTKDPDNKTYYYSGTQHTSVSPSEVMGMAIYSWLSGNTWKPDNGTVTWTIYNPCGFTTLTASGLKYRDSTDWPVLATFQKSTDGKTWSNVWNTEATPASAVTWTATSSHSSVSLGGTYYYLRAILSGSVAGAIGHNSSLVEGNNAAIEWSDVTAVIANNPTVIFGAEQNNYNLGLAITNNTTGDEIEFDSGMQLNDTVEIDTANKTATITSSTTEKSENKIGDLEFSSVRPQWLDLQAGANVIQFDDLDTTGTPNLTVNVYWHDRNN